MYHIRLYNVRGGNMVYHIRLYNVRGVILCTISGYIM